MMFIIVNTYRMEMPVVDVNKHGVRLLAKSVSGACLDFLFENMAMFHC